MSTEVIEYSVVIPIYNEEECIRELYQRLSAVLDQLDGPAEIVFVDDASTDASETMLLALVDRDPRVKVIELSRNFGHQIAISAGLDYSSGSATIVLDADLQDPPEVIPELAARWREGSEIVYAVRQQRRGETWFKRSTAFVFYRIMRRAGVNAPLDTGDFRLVDRRALDAFKAMRESNRYVRGMFSWIGFKQSSVSYVRAERYAGRTKYSLPRMSKFAVDALLSFSNAPLKIALNCGFIVSIGSFLGGLAAIAVKIANLYTVPGWASLVVVASFLGGIQLLLIGVVGEYIARIYDEVKGRPLYVVREAHGVDATRSYGRPLASTRLPQLP